MIPIPGLESVRCDWVTITKEHFQLHGFLLYIASDHFFPDYIDGEGLNDLDIWTGHDCGIFIVHSPSAQWIEYTKATNHVWWKLFGKNVEWEPQLLAAFERHANKPILQIDGERRTMQELFAPRLNQFLHGHEIAKILDWFDLRETQHPSLIFFKDLHDRRVKYVDMQDLVGMPERDLRRSLKQWFGGPVFAQILQEAQNA